MAKLMTSILTACVAAAFLLGTAVAEDKDPLDGLKCFIMKKRDVKGKKVVDFKGAKLYLCCSTCVKRVAKTPEKYEAKANHQLVLTGQFAQKACPLSGEAVKDDATVKIDGVVVKFSSAAHKEKIAKLEEDKQIEMVFGKDGFKKGKFELVKKTKKDS